MIFNFRKILFYFVCVLFSGVATAEESKPYGEGGISQAQADSLAHLVVADRAKATVLYDRFLGGEFIISFCADREIGGKGRGIAAYNTISALSDALYQASRRVAEKLETPKVGSVADESEILIFGPDYDSGWDKAYGFDQEYPDSVVSVCEANFQAAETIHNDQASDLVRYDPWQDRSDTTKQVTERNNKRLLKLCLSGAIRLKNNMSCEEWLE